MLGVVEELGAAGSWASAAGIVCAIREAVTDNSDAVISEISETAHEFDMVELSTSARRFRTAGFRFTSAHPAKGYTITKRAGFRTYKSDPHRSREGSIPLRITVPLGSRDPR
jgi:hypothetical protein